MNIEKSFATLKKRSPIVIVISFFLVIAIMVVGHQFLTIAEENIFLEFNKRQLVMAKAAASGIEMYFETLATALRTTGHMPEIKGFEEGATRRILAFEFSELKQLGINDISVMDAGGIIRYTVVAPQLENKDFSWRKYYQEAKKMNPDDSYIIQQIEFKGVDVGKMGVLVAVPMYTLSDNNDDGTISPIFSGLILCTLKLDTLTQRFISPLKSSEHGHAFLLDEGFKALWMPDHSLVGKSLLEETKNFPSFQLILNKMTRGGQETSEFSYKRFDEIKGQFTHQKQKNLVAHVPVHLGNAIWTLGVWAPKENANALIHSIYIKQQFLLFIIIIIILLGAAYILLILFRYNRILEDEVNIKTNDIQSSHERLLTVLDKLDAMVHVADLKTHKLLFTNKYYRNLFGDVLGQPCWKVMQKGQTQACDFCPNHELLTKEGIPGDVNTWEFQNTITKKWYFINDRAISWVDGSYVRLQVATDITERKHAEDELKNVNQKMETFCHILKEISVQQTLEGVGILLIKELQTLLNSEFMRMYIFGSDRNTIFILSNKGSETITDPALTQDASHILKDLDGITAMPKSPFLPPFIPEDFPKDRQTIIPIKNVSRFKGAFVIACSKNWKCDQRNLEMASLILDQASGTIKRALLHKEEVLYLQNRIETTSEFRGIIGKDPKMQVIYKLIEDIAPTDATVIIQGESGTGKELVARAIHRQSQRKEKPFVVINCSAYPDTLLESELFGHEKGSFTGATRQKSGRFEQAHGGTVFLDEIGEVAPSAQIRLLRVLQTRKFERLGGEQTIEVDARILAATNRDLLKEVKKGNFREDLFYRLNVIPIQLPALKVRRNDIPLLVRHFQHKFTSEMDETSKGLSSEAMRRLLDYHWPGNVRELENSIEHAVVLAKGNRIETSHLPSGLNNVNVQAMSGAHSTILENEKRMLLDALEECDWNKKQAAQRLGISRSSLYSKLKKFNITKPTIL